MGNTPPVSTKSKYGPGQMRPMRALDLDLPVCKGFANEGPCRMPSYDGANVVISDEGAWTPSVNTSMPTGGYTDENDHVWLTKSTEAPVDSYGNTAKPVWEDPMTSKPMSSSGPMCSNTVMHPLGLYMGDLQCKNLNEMPLLTT